MREQDPGSGGLGKPADFSVESAGAVRARGGRRIMGPIMSVVFYALSTLSALLALYCIAAGESADHQIQMAITLLIAAMLFDRRPRGGDAR